MKRRLAQAPTRKSIDLSFMFDPLLGLNLQFVFIVHVNRHAAGTIAAVLLFTVPTVQGALLTAQVASKDGI